MPDNPYVIGDAHANQLGYARFETKPAAWTGRRWDTGSGYERWRSYEYRPETSRVGKEDVYVSVHRLCAVAWLLPPDAPLSAMQNVDVHHNYHVEWANFGESSNFDEPGLALLEHGRHSEITQAELRAWGEDAKRQAAGEIDDDGVACVRCSETPDVACESPDWDGIACLECAKRLSDGATIEVL